MNLLIAQVTITTSILVYLHLIIFKYNSLADILCVYNELDRARGHK